MKIGILTSGGDCPGINATVRGVCKTAINHYGMEVYGIHSGFRGLLDNDVEPLTEEIIIRLVKFGRNNIRYFQRKAIQETPVGSLGRQTSFDVKEYS